MVDNTAGDPSQIAWYIYDMHHGAGILLRQLCPEMHTSGPVRVFRKRSTDDFTGWTVWGCSPVFARLAIERPELFDGKSVLELGAGCGLAGLAVACCTRATSICISDFPTETMRNLVHNVGLNCQRVTVGAPQASVVPGAEPGVPIVASLGGEVFSVNDTFIAAGTGCRISIAQIDWDVEETWPRAQYDVIVAADLLPRESYGRSLAHVVKGLLRPGGILIVVTPAVREGLPVLDTSLRESGYTASEEVIEDDWRANPLRRPDQATPAALAASTSKSGLDPTFGGVARGAMICGVSPSTSATEPEPANGDLEPLRRALARAGATAEGALRFITDDEATDMFPELSRPSYDILAVTFTSPRLLSGQLQSESQPASDSVAADSEARA